MAIYNVDSFQSLSAAISSANLSPEADQIQLIQDIVLTGDLPKLNDDPNDILSISGSHASGQSFSISGNQERRIFWVQDGRVALDELTLTQGLAQGETGGGGGAGMGGALFIFDGDVSLSNASLTQNQAIGGSGGTNATGGGLGGIIRDVSADGNDGSDGIANANEADGGSGNNGGIGGNGGSGGSGATYLGSGSGTVAGVGGGTGGAGGSGGFGGGGGSGGSSSINSSGGSGGSGGFGGGGGNGGSGSGSRTGLGSGGEGGNGGFGGGGGGGGLVFSTSGGSGGTGGFGGGDGSSSVFSPSSTNSNGGGGGGAGLGGGIFIRTGALTVNNSLFEQNLAQGGAGADNEPTASAGQGLGGGIFALHQLDGSIGSPLELPTVALTDVTFSDNVAGQAGVNNLVDLRDDRNLFVSTTALTATGLTSTSRLSAIAWNQDSGSVSSLSLTPSEITLESINRTISDRNWQFQATGDLNGDGQDDVLLRNFAAGINLVWYMAPGGGSIESEAPLGRTVEDPAWEIVGTGDFNGDGNTDLLWHNTAADQIVTWYMDGNGGIESESLVGRSIGDSQWEIVATADFNGDGNTDILLRHGTVGQNILWEMDGTSIINESSFGRDVPDTQWRIEGARDVDGNGTVDVLLRQREAGQGLIWSMADKTTIGSEFLVAGTPSSNSQLVL